MVWSGKSIGLHPDLNPVDYLWRDESCPGICIHSRGSTSVSRTSLSGAVNLSDLVGLFIRHNKYVNNLQFIFPEKVYHNVKKQVITLTYFTNLLVRLITSCYLSIKVKLLIEKLNLENMSKLRLFVRHYDVLLDVLTS